MSPIIIEIIGGITVLASITLLMLILANWGQPHMRYLACLSFLVSLNALGYFLDITAVSKEAALVAYKMEYYAGPFMGPFCLLFSREYYGRPIRNRFLIFSLFIIPLFISILVLSDPLIHLYIYDVAFVPVGAVMRLVFKPGFFYFVNLIYNYSLVIACFISISITFAHTNTKGFYHNILFIGIMLFIFVSKLIWWMGILLEFDSFCLASTVSLGIFYLYIMRHRKIEWIHLGWERVLRNITDAVIVINENQIIIRTNASFEFFFPTFKLLEGQTPLSHFLTHIKNHSVATDPKTLFEDIKNPHNVLYQGEFTIGSLGSQEKQTFTMIRQLVKADDRVVGQTITLSDVSTYHAMIEEMINLNIKAEASSRSKSVFLATMSHEIRTPLNAIIGLSEIQLQKDLPRDTRADLEKIYNSGSGLLGIINDILDISKIESGNLELVPVKYSLPSIINDTIQLNIVRIGSKPITFELQIDEFIPCQYFGDEMRIKQILNNLLSNAIKYTEAGRVILKAAGIREELGFSLIFSVIDTGQGIREEDIQKLFSRYSQLHSPANRNIEGTGLGLSIVKNLVELMGGNVTVKSTYGQGSTFTVKIPQEVVDETPIGKETAMNLINLHFMENRRSRGKNLIRTYMPYGKVLVVDDVETNLDVARGLMLPYGLTIDSVTSGKEAIERIRFGGTMRYDAVFMDHMMPEMDGIEAVKIIRALNTEYAKTVPIIALTANAMSGNKELFLSCGFNSFISKPIDIMQLDTVLNKWVRDRQQETEGEAAKARENQQNSPPDPGVLEGRHVEGIDIEAGIERYSGGEPYLQILRSYLTHTPELLDKLRQVSPETLKQYEIVIHGLKGSSYGICAETLGKQAEGLEFAAKAGSFHAVEAGNSIFIEALEEVLASLETLLKAITQEAMKEKKSAAVPDHSLLRQLLGACKQYKSSIMEEIQGELERYTYESGGELIEWLREQFDNLEYDAIRARLEEHLLDQ